MPYPLYRPRRLRESPLVRKMVRETILRTEDLVYPLFAVHGRGVREPIGPMPGQFRLSVDELLKECKDAASMGIPAVLLFGPALVAFLIIEQRQRHPLMPFSIFRLRTLRGADIVGLLIGMSLFSMFFFISLYLQNVLHYSPIKTGLSYLPLAVGIILSAGAASVESASR